MKDRNEELERVAIAYLAAERGMTIKKAGTHWDDSGTATRSKFYERASRHLDARRVDELLGEECRIEETPAPVRPWPERCLAMEAVLRVAPRSATAVAAALRDLALNPRGENELDRGRSLLALEAAEHIETLSADVRAAESTAERLLAAFAKFDGEDWDFLLGLKEYGRNGQSVPYCAVHDGARERVWKEALGVLREICEAAAAKEPERPEPSELARLFVKRWAPNLPPAEQEEMALSFDHEVAQEMVRSAE